MRWKILEHIILYSALKAIKRAQTWCSMRWNSDDYQREEEHIKREMGKKLSLAPKLCIVWGVRRETAIIGVRDHRALLTVMRGNVSNIKEDEAKGMLEGRK